jgi:NADH pyrophosphatase NudC (nudix superfamily)
MRNKNQGLLKYCPNCSKLAKLVDSRKILCGDCGFKLYLNTAAAVAGVIVDGDGRVMFIRRNREPRKGFLDLPGGFVDFGEDGETALRREVLEELGVEVTDVKYLRSIPNTYEYADILYHTLDLFFTCRMADGVDLASIQFDRDEISEILYKCPKVVSLDEIAFDSMKLLFRYY